MIPDFPYVIEAEELQGVDGLRAAEREAVLQLGAPGDAVVARNVIEVVSLQINRSSQAELLAGEQGIVRLLAGDSKDEPQVS